MIIIPSTFVDLDTSLTVIQKSDLCIYLNMFVQLSLQLDFKEQRIRFVDSSPLSSYSTKEVLLVSYLGSFFCKTH